MKNRNIIALVLALVLCCPVFCFPAAAEAESQSYTFTLEPDAASVTVGDIVTFSVQLKENSESSYKMYAISGNIRFQEAMFSLISCEPENGVSISKKELSGSWKGWKDVSFNVICDEYDGDTWNSPTLLATVKLKAIAAGGSEVCIHDTEVSNFDASASYPSTGKSVWINVNNPAANRTEASNTTDASNSETKDTGSRSGSSSTNGSGGSSGSSGNSGSSAKTDSTAAVISEKTDTTDASAESNPTMTPKSETYKNPFNDVPEDAWYADAIQYVVKAGLYEGTGADTFTPDGTMTRGMFATVLHRYAKLPAATKEAAFTDTVKGSWYADAVAWAAENNIVSGYGDGRFGPEDSITLEQMITVLYRYQGGTAAGNTPTLYGTVSPWAADAMRWAYAGKLFDGVGGTLIAGKPATRAQVAGFMANLYASGKK